MAVHVQAACRSHACGRFMAVRVQAACRRLRVRELHGRAPVSNLRTRAAAAGDRAREQEQLLRWQCTSGRGRPASIEERPGRSFCTAMAGGSACECEGLQLAAGLASRSSGEAQTAARQASTSGRGPGRSSCVAMVGVGLASMSTGRRRTMVLNSPAMVCKKYISNVHISK